MQNIDEKIYQEAEARVSFKWHLGTYIVINIFIWGFWYFTRAIDGNYDGFWPVYPTLGWGIGVVSHYIGAYKSGYSAIEREVEKIKKERGLN